MIIIFYTMRMQAEQESGRGPWVGRRGGSSRKKRRRNKPRVTWAAVLTKLG